MSNKNKLISSGKTGSPAEDIFIDLFCDVFGPKNSQFLYLQYPFTDIYGGQRYLDFAIKSENEKIAIEIDGETFHNPKNISDNKYADDLLKQNSIIYDEWKIYRWTYNQLKNQPEKTKDEMTLFLGHMPQFKILDDFLPNQKGQSFELKDHQEDALKNLNTMREKGESIALLYHATGTGKTTTSVLDAKRMGLKTLFLAHRTQIIKQAKETFKNLWPNAHVGLYVGGIKEDGDVICASIQSITNDLHKFNPEDFGYIIIDEAHHAAATSYKSILSYFKPKFTLGLTATPNRMDGEDLLKIFQNIGHKLDLKTAIEIGELTPIRCIRVQTNIDISDVKINGIKYNHRDLESKLFIPDRNKVIVDTYINIVKNKKTVVFCASVSHAKTISSMLKKEGINSESISGQTPEKERLRILSEYENGDINVLCACDLLNEGWDSPKTEVLFMARPTLSKTLYLQQLGRGMRLSENKEFLMVFDFIDNANLFNMPYSVHRVFDISKYRPGALVAGPKNQMVMEKDMIYKGEKPDVLLDYPVDIHNYEIINLFDWQKEAKNMVSEMEFVRLVTAQHETIRKYIREELIKPDLEIPMGNKIFNYFKKDKVAEYANKFGWDLITPANIKNKFMDYIKIMDMSYSYKPVFLKAVLRYMDTKGMVLIDDIVQYFIRYYEGRREQGLIVEKKKCLYLREYTESEVKKNILSNPFKRFQDMNFMDYHKEIEYIKINNNIMKNLNDNDIIWIEEHCDKKLKEYFA